MDADKNLLVTGAAGFIGSTFVRQALANKYQVTILDALTYAGHRENLEEVLDPTNCVLVEGDIRNPDFLRRLFAENSFSGVLNFAAESHVDNSILGPQSFIETNLLGTFHLLEAARGAWTKMNAEQKSGFRFLHVSTDEVFGELGPTGHFTEETAYDPNSPYSASKAGSDHLVRAWHHTYGLPTLITNCSNNYGPRQFPEKLIPRMITQALKGEKLPVYGRGQNIRDWIHVEDHSAGILLAFEKAQPGATYCFGGNCEMNNLDVVKMICQILDEKSPRPDGKSHSVGIEFVTDRAGHDFRYAIDDRKAQRELGFQRRYANFEQGLRQTVEWYLQNSSWIERVLKSAARKRNLSS